MDNMDIAVLVDTLSIEKGTGIARYSNYLVNGLKKADLNVSCIYPSSPNGSLPGVIDHSIKLPIKIFKQRKNYDIFHATSPVTGLGLILTNKPKIVTYHDLASILYSPEAKYHIKVLAPYFYRIGEYCEKIISVSTQTKKELVDYFQFPEEKIVVINHGIDDCFYHIPKTNKDTYTIGFVGAISPRKRIDYLLKAFYLFKKEHEEFKVKLVICGKKNMYYSKVQMGIDELNLNHFVEFKDFVPDDQLNMTYNSFDIMVLPSEWEGFGIPILEAQKCGIPVLIRENAHIPLEVSKYCIKCKTEKEMADQFFNLLNDHNLYNEVSNNGIIYSNKFNWNDMVKNTIKVYNEII